MSKSLKPSPGAVLNRSDRLARNLVFATMSDGMNQADYVSRELPSYYGAGGDFDGKTIIGDARESNSGSDGGMAWPLSSYVKTIKDKFTIMVWADIDSTNAYASLFSIPYRFNGTWLSPYHALSLIQDNNTSQGRILKAVSGGVKFVDSDNGFIIEADGLPHLYGVVGDGADIIFCRDGYQFGDAKTIASGNVDFSQAQEVMIMQRSSNPTGEGYNGRSPGSFLWREALALTEVREFHRDTSRFLRKPVSVYLFGGSVGGAYSIVGAVTLTATAASTMRFKRLIVGTGTLTAVSNATFRKKVSIAGSGILSAVSNSGFRNRVSIVGAVVLSAVSSSAFRNTASIAGAATLTISAAAAFRIKKVISGAGTLTATGAAGLRTSTRVINGTATLSMVGGGGFRFKVNSVGSGSVSVVSNSTFRYKRAISGAVVLSASNASQMRAKRVVVGDAFLGLSSASTMGFSGPAVFIGNVTLRLTTSSIMVIQGLNFTPNAFRTLIVEAEDRFLKIGEETRRVKVAAENRFSEV